jgi:hypothetical protein
LAHYFKSDLKLFAILSSWIVAIFLVVAWGSSWPEIRSIQPLRFIVLFWIILSAVGGIGADLLTQKYNVGVYRRIYEIFIMGFVMLAFGWVGLFSIPPASLVNALPEGQQKMMDYLRSNPSGSGRFLLECGDWPWPHFADILPFFTNQILLGGPGAGVFLASRSTLFIGRTVFIKKTVDGVTNIQNDNPTIFNKPFKSFDEKTFQSYLNLYNIHQIGAWSNLSVTYLQQFNQTLQNEGLYGDFTVFRVRNPKGWFFEGTGKLRMDYDELVLTDVSPGFLIIKCHWMKGLRTSPALPISPIYLLDDPVPFIQIDNTIGAKEVIIKNAGL